MKKKQGNLQIKGKEVFPNNYVLFEIRPDKKIEFITPGQFINVRVSGEPDTFLRRPFSIHDVDYGRNGILFLMKIVGPGTKALSKLSVDDKMDVLYPLGNGFTLQRGKRVLLAGGGYGIAPLYHLASELIGYQCKIDFLLGAKKIDDLVLLDKFKAKANLEITTEDGSSGFKGLITEHPFLQEKIRNYDAIYCCGPEPMMRAAALIANKNEIWCEVSLDQMMGCGIGVCLSCVAKTTRGHETSCIHGPVFNSKDIIW